MLLNCLELKTKNILFQAYNVIIYRFFMFDSRAHTLLVVTKTRVEMNSCLSNYNIITIVYDISKTLRTHVKQEFPVVEYIMYYCAVAIGTYSFCTHSYRTKSERNNNSYINYTLYSVRIYTPDVCVYRTSRNFPRVGSCEFLWETAAVRPV